MRQDIRTVSVKVTDPRPSGIHVSLLDHKKQRGFIRPREISWERRISVPLSLPEEGAILQAVVLEEEDHHENMVFLSLRRVTNPWKAAIEAHKYRVGQIVNGEVVNVRNSGVYVQLEPGIDALIVPKDVPMLRGQSIEDVLWLGDLVSGTIASIDKVNHHIHLNLVRRLQGLPADLDERQKQLLEYFGADNHPGQVEFSASVDFISDTRSRRPFVQSSMGKLHRVLIVDDEEEWLNFIGGEMEREYKVSVETATNGGEGIAKLLDGPPYSLILIDLNLKEEKGTEVARRIRRENINIPIVIMSVAEFDENGRYAIEEEFPFCHKSTEALIDKIDELRHGYWLVTPETTIDRNHHFMQHLEMQTFSNQEPGQIYSGILNSLYKQTEASHCLLLEYDKSLQSISIIGSYPALSGNDLKLAQDGLYYSPARQVIEEERELYLNDIDFDNDQRFKNFFINLDFQSFLGIPVHLPERPTRHGLFLLSQDPFGFMKGDGKSDERFVHARIAGSFLTVTIERLMLIEYMWRYEEKYSLGQLLSDMVHEVNNKLTAMDGSLGRLNNLRQSRPMPSEPVLLGEWWDKIDREIQLTTRLQSGLKELVLSYSRQVRNDYDVLDVNHLVEDVGRQLARRAKQTGVTIYLDLADKLPPVHAIQSQLQQIIMNLALNAIQMMAEQRDRMKIIGDQSRKYIPALQMGVMIIQTRLRTEGNSLPVEVRIIDNGPGIHWRDRDRIFSPGFSRRGGAGLGLFISRNLAERMGGRLSLLGSTMFLGSAFALELASQRP